MTETKICIKCKRKRPISEFHLSGRRAGRYCGLPRRRTTCRQCEMTAHARKRELSLRELAIENANQDLFVVVNDVRELYLLGVITHPLFIALASRANEVLARIYGRRWDGGEKGETVEQQRRWIEENGFKILNERKKHKARSAVPIEKEQKLLVKKVYGEISKLRVSGQGV